MKHCVCAYCMREALCVVATTGTASVHASEAVVAMRALGGAVRPSEAVAAMGAGWKRWVAEERVR